jgi:hypothetical protein
VTDEETTYEAELLVSVPPWVADGPLLIESALEYLDGFAVTIGEPGRRSRTVALVLDRDGYVEGARDGVLKIRPL